MQNKSVYILIVKFFFLCAVLFFSAVGFARTSDFRFAIIMGFALILALIDYMSKVVSNKKNYQEILINNERIKKMEAELDSLHEVSKVITSTFDVKVIMEHTYNELVRITRCEWYYVCFVDKESFEPAFNYEFGNQVLKEAGNIDYEQYVRNLAKSNPFSEPQIETLLREEKREIMAISLNVSDELIGAIFIGSSKTGAFSEVNLSFLKSLAGYVAIGIRNAEMFNNIYSQKQEIEALYEQAAASNEELNSYIKELDKTKEELNQKNIELMTLFDNIQYGYLQTVMCLANSIEAKDPYTRGHCQRVMEISCELARAMKLSEEEIKDLRYAAILHDIGKIGISASILNKQGKLTDEEFEEIKKHPIIAYNILKDVEFLKNGLNGILQHHERYDGKGYPYGLKGEEICIFARIMCVADAFDAMTSDRPYRKGMDMKSALEEIKRCRGTQFDPEIADLLLMMADEGRTY
ncbi:GAF domain-containing protein [Acetivibrio thermocellus AD2]|jgi:HD-GYP domain-containing protein (c-di-GMP phosphodiesterase class II)|uniref:GAF domain-containing protein n=1 Tax=Acetivibrio thermocellus AD2 TaxID=1138384 RepID=A0AB36TGD0_ACETH|nr:HD domain-containing phosphohydrolase [Acetivibrio thermocellus]ADU74041.1 metal dependent phosphohydrolase [Acetivibrio thermocellus DSM 1313]ALX07979.1 metal dependent phosphohydrolase [Acetivibrio thermocellus AD2]ANV75725.1 metal dependent phosphohydrolase [Acetivibrio thermocellus DSM 2360]EIC06177.1 metal-dependent phosphohydrolase HD sub domain-containing protein [Acetivibrio thermocellus YS]PFH02250.1 GAF domain-containing protein [Acetivibrio thermocellus AD2]